MKIDGRALADQLLRELKIQVDTLKQTQNTTPHLAVVFVGDNSASETYIKQKRIAAEKVGIKFTLVQLEATTPVTEVENKVKQLASDPTVHGLIVQRPLPFGFSTEDLTNLVPLPKDVDGFKTGSTFIPPVAAAVMKLLSEISRQQNAPNFSEWIKNKSVVLIGRGETAGTPIAKTLTKNGVSFTQIHSQTENKEQLIKTADIVISAVGKPQILTAENIKSGAILIGVGLHEAEGKLKGDYEDLDIEPVASYFSPTPGGTGPVNVASLMENVVTAAQAQLSI